MNKRLGWGLVACLVAVVLGFQNVGQTQPPPPTTGTVEIRNRVELYNENRQRIAFSSFVTLFKDGQPVRTSEATYGKDDIYWNDVPKGVYEVQFESHGYGKVVKRAAVSPNERTIVTLTDVGPKDEVMGVGPTLYELEARIKKLEAQVAAK